MNKYKQNDLFDYMAQNKRLKSKFSLYNMFQISGNSNAC